MGGIVRPHSHAIALLKAATNGRVIALTTYKGRRSIGSFLCNKHLYKFRTNWDNALSGKCCYECGKEKMGLAHRKHTHDEVVMMLKPKGITLLDTFQHKDQYIRYRCKCGYVGNVQARSLLTYLSCKACGQNKGNKGRATYKRKRVGGRVVGVLGYEGRVIDTLVKRGVKPENLCIASEGTVPTIMYRWQGRKRSYRPDLMVRTTKRLYEVKSNYYLGLHCNELYQQNRAKARAAIKAGFPITFVLCYPHIERVFRIEGEELVNTRSRREFVRQFEEKHDMNINGFDGKRYG